MLMRAFEWDLISKKERACIYNNPLYQQSKISRLNLTGKRYVERFHTPTCFHDMKHFKIFGGYIYCETNVIEASN